MAGLGYRSWADGAVLTAAQVQGYLQDQAVMVFAGTAARGSALPTPSEGMICYLQDTDAVEVYNGSAWAGLGAKATVSGTTGSPTVDSSSRSGKTIYIFNGSGTITFSKAGTVEVLCLAGGGGGGAPNNFTGGGGGGGGYQESTTFQVTAHAYTVTVGGGGSIGNVGSDSVFAGGPNLKPGLTSRGGGNGGTGDGGGGAGGGGAGGSAGGAGGGGGSPSGGTALYSGAQGFNGAVGAGGGAGGAASGNTAGVGRASSITGSSVTRGAGGVPAASGTAGSANTGKGGGGNAAGGSGVVIVVVG